MVKSRIFIFMFLLTALVSATNVWSQTTEFIYQGQLQSSSALATGNYDFEFLLFDSVSGGNQIGSTLTKNSVTVTGGIFAVPLDFGSNFPGVARFLEIHVRQTGGGSFTPLTPRQAIASTPYSIKSLNADTAVNAQNATIATNAVNASNATQLGGVPANQFVQTTDPRLADARAPTAGSSNYVQNSTNLQPTSNFNISGTGSANILNARTQFNLNGDSILSNAGDSNLFAGSGAGPTSGNGKSNAFFGYHAGLANVNGNDNSFFGRSAGSASNGGANSFFGSNAGIGNTDGGSNSFFGGFSGRDNTAGNTNSFFGFFSGLSNHTGSENAFFGESAGKVSNGNQNTYIGSRAGWVSEDGTDNTALGYSAGTNFTGLSFATAIGAFAIAGSSNHIQLGRFNQDTVSVGVLTAASATPVCINGTTFSSCSSSQRYKHNILPLTIGMSLIRSLRPVTFDWNERNEPDLGFVAEEVNMVNPLLVTHNFKGEIEGVKYDQISAVLVNAIKEQQAQIEAQAKQIDRQRAINKTQEAEIAALKALVCVNHRRAAACRAIK